jgi:hypothetical protein
MEYIMHRVIPYDLPINDHKLFHYMYDEHKIIIDQYGIRNSTYFCIVYGEST